MPTDSGNVSIPILGSVARADDISTHERLKEDVPLHARLHPGRVRCAATTRRLFFSATARVRTIGEGRNGDDDDARETPRSIGSSPRESSRRRASIGSHPRARGRLDRIGSDRIGSSMYRFGVTTTTTTTTTTRGGRGVTKTTSTSTSRSAHGSWSEPVARRIGSNVPVPALIRGLTHSCSHGSYLEAYLSTDDGMRG